MNLLRNISMLTLIMAASMFASKEQAPVNITANVGTGTTTLTFTFGRAASSVNVHVRGANGLTVYSNEDLVQNGAFQANQTVQYTVSHSSNSGHHDLVIEVTGKFAGSTGHKIQSVSIGAQAPASPPYTIKTGSDGQQIIEMQGTAK